MTYLTVLEGTYRIIELQIPKAKGYDITFVGEANKLGLLAIIVHEMGSSFFVFSQILLNCTDVF